MQHKFLIGQQPNKITNKKKNEIKLKTIVIKNLTDTIDFDDLLKTFDFSEFIIMNVLCTYFALLKKIDRGLS